MRTEPLTASRGSALVLEQVRKAFGGAVAVDEVSLSVAPSEFVTLLGPSGSGKTTVLRMIGGFIAPDGGRILIDDNDVVKVPVERRPTAMLFQQLSLWPHLSVARNVSFGLELRKRPKTEIRTRVAELLEIVGLADFGGRLPAQLSGGQQQRVALARALALEPRILLLDEPFSALDTKLRVELRTFVRSLQREVGTTTILVTHDQEEALELSDRIAVLRDGRIEQIGTPGAIYDTPETGFVAEFLGAMNFLAGTVDGRLARLSGGITVPLDAVPTDEVGAGRVEIGVRPEDVIVTPDPGGAFVVERVTRKGYVNELFLRSGPVSLRAYVGKDLALEPGGSCALRFGHLHLFSARPPGGEADGEAPLATAPIDALAEMTNAREAAR
ncbi:MAG: ABC transporter ATP-binding protein [Actinomycetota bacterium]|nr:ABC transporter ATP-binding protein [Actinomycetota bacterium]